MKLTFTTKIDDKPIIYTRNETEATVIATLKRKGWKESAPDAPADATVLVPGEVPLWAFRATLEVAGLTKQVETLLAALPGSGGIVARNQWEYATVAVRTDPTIRALAGQLKLTDAQVDEYFIKAAALVG